MKRYETKPDWMDEGRIPEPCGTESGLEDTRITRTKHTKSYC
ncbi:MAG: hypothetical protein BAJATHORv1_40202 [Candidatus Thorarchaeota archaeon]|nr:MAG: hypothetical protein BAJATHORv1_40202 [Candidatus Thorarchaeota archaeon]